MAYSDKAMKELMDSSIEKLGLPGIDCIVYHSHKEIFRYQAGYGDMEAKTPPALDALYNIYSATKMVTCVAAMQLVEQGRMHLLDPVHKYLPEYKDILVKYGSFIIVPAKKHMRILDLFTMTVGITYDLDTAVMRKFREETNDDFDSRAFVAQLAKEPQLFEPGDSWSYSYCHDILGVVVEVISGMSLGEYFKMNIFEPLGMEDTFFTTPPDKKSRLAPQYEYDFATAKVKRISTDCIGRVGKRQESGGGGLISSTNDYILFADALACGGVGVSGQQIISERSIRLMRENRLSGKLLDEFMTLGAMVGSASGVGYGLGVGVFFDAAAACTLVPEGSFYWGGLGGVQNLIDIENKVSYYVSMHNVRNPTVLLRPYMLNTLYGSMLREV